MRCSRVRLAALTVMIPARLPAGSVLWIRGTRIRLEVATGTGRRQLPLIQREKPAVGGDAIGTQFRQLLSRRDKVGQKPLGFLGDHTLRRGALYDLVERQKRPAESGPLASRCRGARHRWPWPRAILGLTSSVFTLSPQTSA